MRLYFPNQGRNEANGIAGIDSTARIADAQITNSIPTQPVRVKDTVYQNTNSRPLKVVVSGFNNADGRAQAFIGSANPPTMEVSREAAFSDSWNFSFTVPVNWYYKITTQIGTTNIEHWTEY